MRTLRPERVTACVVARETLTRCGVELGADFHTLSRSQVDALLVEAIRQHYRKPRNANGSRARYFHERMQRKANDRAVVPLLGDPRWMRRALAGSVEYS